MKIAFYIIIGILICGYIAKTSITFKPFSIKFEQPIELAGYVFLVLSLACFKTQAKLDTSRSEYERGVIEMAAAIKEEMKKGTLTPKD